MKFYRFFLSIVFGVSVLSAQAQIGEHRDSLMVGGNVGFVMSSVGFSPKVTQGQHPGVSAGFCVRYTSEKYFKTLASIYAECNFSQMGWKEDIVDIHSQPVIGENGTAEKYSRTLTYITVPLMAHLAWGNERKGAQFFFRAGPQFGYLLGESSSYNFDLANPNLTDRANHTVEQYNHKAEKKFDYGIAAGLGVELVDHRYGGLLLEGRYYMGLGNIFNSSKKDYFGKSDNICIEVRLSYLTDLKHLVKSINKKTK